MALIDKDPRKKFKEALADIIVSSQGLCTYDACKDVAEREATFLISMLLPEPNIQSSNIKETVRKEIERRIKVAKVEYESTHAPEYEGIDIELNSLLAFLDTLEAEEKDVDLAEHYKQWVERYKEQHDGDFPDAQAIALHFYEFGCRHTAEMYDNIEHERQRTEEAELSGDLEEEIDKYFQGWINDDEYGDALMPDYTGVDVDKCKEIARHFAEWGASHAEK